jgi:hypothetical protein
MLSVGPLIGEVEKPWGTGGGSLTVGAGGGLGISGAEPVPIGGNGCALGAAGGPGGVIGASFVIGLLFTAGWLLTS